MSVRRTKADDVRTGQTVRVGGAERHIIGSRRKGDGIELLTTIGTLMVPRDTFVHVVLKDDTEADASDPEPLKGSSETAKAASSVPAAVFRVAGS